MMVRTYCSFLSLFFEPCCLCLVLELLCFFCVSLISFCPFFVCRLPLFRSFLHFFCFLPSSDSSFLSSIPHPFSLLHRFRLPFGSAWLSFTNRSSVKSTTKGSGEWRPSTARKQPWQTHRSKCERRTSWSTRSAMRKNGFVLVNLALWV